MKPTARSSAFERGFRAGVKAAAEALDRRARMLATTPPDSLSHVEEWRRALDPVTFRNLRSTATHDAAAAVRAVKPMPAPRAPKDR